MYKNLHKLNQRELIMKTRLQFLAIFSFLTLNFSNSYSVPLNGTYTIGSGGDYLSIISAVNDASIQGINGPVIFNILSGVYNENVDIPVFPGSDSNNTFTIKSFSGNSSDVLVDHIGVGGTYITIQNLSLNTSTGGIGHNINFIGNDLRNNQIIFSLNAFNPDVYNINIKGNRNISGMHFSGEFWIVSSSVYNVQIKNNIINGDVYFRYCYNFLIENNTISGDITGDRIGYGGTGFNTIRNKIIGKVLIGGNVINNFIIGKFYSSTTFFCNNTIVGGSIDTPTVNFNYSQNSCCDNIIINPAGGAAMNFDTGVSDYNVLYNGGNNGLILNQGNSYNSVTDFYNATGFDEHSTSQPVTFVSPIDLHLAFPSYGDPQLIGIPDPNVIDDIDGDIRNPLYPYKGADEIFDIPIIIKLKVLMEGMYSSLYNQQARTDSVTLFLRDVTSPFSLRDSAKLTIDSLTFSNTFAFFNAPPGNYYIVAKHFNCIETWSKAGGENLFSDTMIYNYDFTTSISQAYGNNLKLKGSKYCLYSGDVNQDGYITLFDVIPIYNGASSFVTGRYKVTDLTGDNIVDLTDVTLCYNNSSVFIGVIRP